MNSVDFCAIYQPLAVNSLVVTQSQESGGMMKKRQSWEEEEKTVKEDKKLGKDGISQHFCQLVPPGVPIR